MRRIAFLFIFLLSFSVASGLPFIKSYSYYKTLYSGDSLTFRLEGNDITVKVVDSNKYTVIIDFDHKWRLGMWNYYLITVTYRGKSFSTKVKGDSLLAKLSFGRPAFRHNRGLSTAVMKYYLNVYVNGNRLGSYLFYRPSVDVYSTGLLNEVNDIVEETYAEYGNRLLIIGAFAVFILIMLIFAGGKK